jgi:hypothetical protein
MSKAGTYLVNGQAGNVGVAGAPILHFSLVVMAPTGKVSGHATISQALGVNSEKPINDVTGEIHAAGFGSVTKLVALKGTYYEPLPPPAIGQISVPFTAQFAIDNDWKGKGGFSCGTVKVDNVPVATQAL